jgi:hypothetical protein
MVVNTSGVSEEIPSEIPQENIEEESKIIF